MTSERRSYPDGVLARLVAETGPVGLAAVSGDGEPLFANAALARLLGYPSVAELLATPLRALHARPELALDILRERLEAGELDGVDMDLVRKDGSPVYVRIHARALQTPDEGLVLVGSVEDITQPRVVQEESVHHEKMEAVARFAAGIAHDFNNLLTSILGEARQLVADAAGSEPHARSAAAILKAARLASTLTQRLLVFAKSEVVRTEVVDLSDAVEALRQAVSSLLPDDVELVWRVEPHVGAVRLVPRHLEHVLANLVTNARDAMPAGGRVVVETGRVSAPDDTAGMDYRPPVPPGRYVSLAVGDRGVGMNRETRQRIFDPFFTTKPLGDGAGLGLTTVYAMVQRAGGHISVLSAPAYGTVARVVFPLHEGPVEAGVAEATPPSVAVGRKPVVLVVDDDEAVRSVMVRFLEKTGHTVLDAPDALVAQDLVRRFQGSIDLMVTDVMMPRVRGTELAEWMRAERPETGLLLVSGYMDSGRIQAWVDVDPDVFLAKPFEPEELLERVRLRLRQRDASGADKMRSGKG